MRLIYSSSEDSSVEFTSEESETESEFENVPGDQSWQSSLKIERKYVIFKYDDKF